MKTRLTILALGIFVMVGSALAQTNQPQAPSAPGWRHSKAGNALKLTDEQKKDVQKIKFDLMQKQIDLRAKIAHARLDYGQLTSADSPDEDAIAAKIDEISKLQVQLKKNLLDGWFAVNKILTPDQQKLWKKVLQHPGMAGRHMMMRMRTNHGMGNGMMQMRRPGMGFGPMLNGGPTVGQGPSNEFDNEVAYLGPMEDSDMFFMNDGINDLDIFDGPAMDNMDMTGPGCMMGQGGLMQNAPTPDNPK
jgi:Spy/CpxP family protein refolding chaperone